MLSLLNRSEPLHVASRPMPLRSWLYIAVFPLAIVYYECVFNLMTSNDLLSWGTKLMLLFSIAYGLLAFLLMSFIKSRRASRIVTTLLLILLTVPYLVEYFVYCGFKTFYDVVTMFSGAKDMAGSYMSEAMLVVFSWNGLLAVVLFSVPAVLFCVFGKHLYSDKLFSWRVWPRCIVFGVAVLCYCGSLLIVHSYPVAYDVYKGSYNYQTAVPKYGLLTAMGLDVRQMFTGEDDGDFELELPSVDVSTVNPAPSVPSQPSNPDNPPKPIVYGDNQLDLNLSGGKGDIEELNQYVSSLSPSKKNPFTGMFEGKNLIMFTAEAFATEVIDPELTPTLYRLATKGVQFKDYYQPASAGTTGGEYQNIFGMMPTASGASFKNTADHYNYMTIGSQLDRLGYYGKAYHNNSYTYYSRDKTHSNLGYSDGFMGYGNGMEKYVKNLWPQSDLEMVKGTLPTYIDKEKFNIYYMTVSGHNGYTTSGNSMTARNWDLVKDLPYSDEVKGYLAANMELEKALTYLVDALEEKGIADDTVICLTTDHFPYGLSDGALEELYGKKVSNEFIKNHSTWILWSGCLEKMEPIVVEAPTFSLDILPTLSNLFGTEFDSRLFPGRDALSSAEAIVFNTGYDWKTQYGTYYASSGKFVPVDGVETPDGYVERMKMIVKNKMRYCKLALDNDYFRYLFDK